MNGMNASKGSCLSCFELLLSTFICKCEWDEMQRDEGFVIYHKWGILCWAPLIEGRCASCNWKKIGKFVNQVGDKKESTSNEALKCSGYVLMMSLVNIHQIEKS